MEALQFDGGSRIGRDWASRRFVRKHSGLHRGLAFAGAMSLMFWVVVAYEAGLIH